MAYWPSACSIQEILLLHSLPDSATYQKSMSIFIHWLLRLAQHWKTLVKTLWKLALKREPTESVREWTGFCEGPNSSLVRLVIRIYKLLVGSVLYPSALVKTLCIHPHLLYHYFAHEHGSPEFRSSLYYGKFPSSRQILHLCPFHGIPDKIAKILVAWLQNLISAVFTLFVPKIPVRSCKTPFFLCSMECSLNVRSRLYFRFKFTSLALTKGGSFAHIISVWTRSRITLNFCNKKIFLSVKKQGLSLPVLTESQMPSYLNLKYIDWSPLAFPTTASRAADLKSTSEFIATSNLIPFYHSSNPAWSHFASLRRPLKKVLYGLVPLNGRCTMVPVILILPSIIIIAAYFWICRKAVQRKRR